MTRVLVVEDDPQLVRALVINLQARTYGVDAAPDGATALRLAAARQPDVGRARPRTARHGRHRRHQGPARLDPRADPGALRPPGLRREGRRARRGRRRLHHQAVQHGRTAGPAAGRRPPHRDRAARPGDHRGHHRRLHHRPARQEGQPRRPRRPSHPDRMASAGDPGPQPRAGSSPSSSCSRRSGAPPRATRPTTFGSTWPSCGANWKRTPPTPGTSSPSPAWATASRADRAFGPAPAPTASDQQTTQETRTMARGKLRIYLGAAPGVGKTYAMLSEAHRRVERGTDCVVAFVEHHDRPRTEVMLHGLEQVPRQELDYRGAVFTEMDVDAVLARRPQVALVDELRAHQHPRLAQHQALAGRRGTARGRHRRRSPRSTSSTWSRSATSSSRSPVSGSRRPCPTRWCAGPTRSSWSTCRRRRCAAGWRTATSTSRTRSTRPCRTTSAPAT